MLDFDEKNAQNNENSHQEDYQDKILSADIVTEVDTLIREVPTRVFEGNIREVIESLKEFEDGFCFVPVMKPAVEGDYYLANRYEVEDERILPEYSQTSEYYYLLKSHETLAALADGLGDHIIARASVQKQISVTLFEPNISNETPLVYYLNSYNRATREKIIMGFALLSFTYMHRRSGTQKDDFENVTNFFKDSDKYTKAVQLIHDYPISYKTFQQAVKKAHLPLKRIAYHYYGIDKEVWKQYDEKDETSRLVFQSFKTRYAPDSQLNLAHLIQWFHDLYHFNTKHERFDVAAKMLDQVSTYLTKSILPDVHLSEII